MGAHDNSDDRGRSDSVAILGDEIRAIANQGLIYATDRFDRERYSRLLRIAASIVATGSSEEPETIHARYRADPYHISPMTGTDAAVMDGDRMLLIRRHDDHKWAMPGGLLEVGETPAEGCSRELMEETGVSGTPERLLGVFDSRLWQYSFQHHLISFVFHVSHITGTPTTTDEAIDIGWFTADELPELSAGHVGRVPLVFELVKNGSVHFDGVGTGTSF